MQKFEREHQNSQQFNLNICLDNAHVIPDAIRSIVIEDDLDEQHICQGMYSIDTVSLNTCTQGGYNGPGVVGDFRR